ncbi:PepSY domain-containing protein [Pseudomonadota bacterium]|jgi:hypothetical protein|nr:PepSY domain-containing protein [Xanthomonadales bacterium]
MTIDGFKRLQFLARWHRRIALLVCIWLVALAATGLLINHANDWGLDRSPLSASLQKLVYGFEATRGESCGRGGAIGPDCAQVFGRLELPAGALLLAPDRLHLLDGTGQLIESLPVSRLGLVGLEGGRREGDWIYLRDQRQTVRTDPELLDWRVLDADTTAVLGSGPWQVRGEATEHITWERFLLDLHAARFLGPLAKTFTDLMAGLILLLALSGAWLWWLKRRRD